MTLHFIGSVDGARFAEVAAGLRVAVTPFLFHLTHAEVWPNGIAVLRAETLPDGLADLHRNLAQALLGLELAVDKRRFRPHVTLARRASRAVPPSSVTTIEWRVDSYALIESERVAGGGYHVRQRYGSHNTPLTFANGRVITDPRSGGE